MVRLESINERAGNRLKAIFAEARGGSLVSVCEQAEWILLDLLQREVIEALQACAQSTKTRFVMITDCYF